MEAEAAAWRAFLAEFDGMAGQFDAGDSWAIAPRGSAKDTPGTLLVNGAGQSGRRLVIDGAPASVQRRRRGR